MDECVMCRRKVATVENWIKSHLWGGFAIFHWRCFGEYLRAKAKNKSRAWSGAQAV